MNQNESRKNDKLFVSRIHFGFTRKIMILRNGLIEVKFTGSEIGNRLKKKTLVPKL